MSCLHIHQDRPKFGGFLLDIDDRILRNLSNDATAVETASNVGPALRVHCSNTDASCTVILHTARRVQVSHHRADNRRTLGCLERMVLQIQPKRIPMQCFTILDFVLQEIQDPAPHEEECG